MRLSLPQITHATVPQTNSHPMGWHYLYSQLKTRVAAT